MISYTASDALPLMEDLLALGLAQQKKPPDRVADTRIEKAGCARSPATTDIEAAGLTVNGS